MGTVTRASARLFRVMLVVWLVAALLPGATCGGDTDQTSPEPSATPADVVLTVHEGLFLLQARDASLKALFDAIGRQLHIEVVARIPADERITPAFDQLSLAEALKRSRRSVNYLVLEDAGNAPATIRQLIVVSKRAAGMPALAIKEDGEGAVPLERRQCDAPTSETPARPQPFRFEFDPAAVGERGR